MKYDRKYFALLQRDSNEILFDSVIPQPVDNDLSKSLNSGERERECSDADIVTDGDIIAISFILE